MLTKATNVKVTKKLLDQRAKIVMDKGYSKQKWIEFCEQLLEEGYVCYLYEARQTFSKYITIKKKKVEVKVRFSNHRPIKSRELNNDCDFFVGITHTGIRTKDDALKFVKEALK